MRATSGGVALTVTQDGRDETLEAERVQELFAEVIMWQERVDADPRSHRRPEGTSAAPTRNPAAAASRSDQTRRSGGSA